MKVRRRWFGLRWHVVGVLCGASSAAAALVAANAATAHFRAAPPDRDLHAVIDATHVPPLLTAPREAVELRYDIVCAAPGRDPESGAACDAGGAVFVRGAGEAAFRVLTLRRDGDAGEGRYYVQVPSDVAASPAGFSYYAVLRNNSTGAATVLPPAGAAAPHWSRPLANNVSVSLGRHVFGATRRPDARVGSAPWGSGPHAVALEDGPETQPIGASAFDVDASRRVVVLDQANRRLLRWAPGARAPAAVALAVDGTLADMSIGSDGTIYVLESASRLGPAPRLRVFDEAGRLTLSLPVGQRTASQVRVGPGGPLVLGYPAGQWMPVVRADGALAPQAQLDAARPGRPLAGGDEVVVFRKGENELRVAVVGTSGVRRSWTISSGTSLAEVQLAEPLGSRLVVVLRVYTETRDEFVALVLDARGIANRFSLDPADWAETAPLTRFRLVGSSLYQLGSTPQGIFVDRFDLEVK